MEFTIDRYTIWHMLTFLVITLAYLFLDWFNTDFFKFVLFVISVFIIVAHYKDNKSIFGRVNMLSCLNFGVTNVILLALLVSIISLAYLEFFRVHVENIETNYILNFLISGEKDIQDKIFTFLSNSLVSPLSEEVYFRYFILFGSVFLFRSKWVGIVFSTWAFSISHESFVVGFIISIAAFSIFFWTENIYILFLFHSFYNFWLSIIELEIIPYVYFNDISFLSHEHIGTVTTICLLLSIFLFKCLMRLGVRTVN
ncbi:TPA: CPBP family glutamic-type intramembrane protease [Vibrio alginolyticus]